MILPHKTPLTFIAKLIKFIPPMPIKPEPARRRIRVIRRRHKCLFLQRANRVIRFWESQGRGDVRELGFENGVRRKLGVDVVGDGGVVVVGDVVQGWIPERAFVGDVGEETEGEDVRVFSGHSVHCVTSECTI